jgi:tetratricopeptide (TPR) repeat protein
LSEVPLQHFEQQARLHYEGLIAAFPGGRLADAARLELAELLYERGAPDPAARLLQDRLAQRPPEDVADRLHLHFGLCLAARGDWQGALAALDDVAHNGHDTDLVARAHFGAAQCFLRRKEWEKATARLVVFRDQPALLKLRDPTGRALLCLGYALGQLGRWDESRVAYELTARHARGTALLADARYGSGWAWQRQGRLGRAADVYRRVANMQADPAPLAQIQVGLCRLQQGRPLEALGAFLLVPYTCNDPELCALALYEAAGALTDLDQSPQAGKVLEQLVKTYRQTRWAAMAR